MSIGTAVQACEYGNEKRGEKILLLGAEHFVADLAGCLYWPAENCLIVSDLHLEKGSSFALKGSLLPPHETGATLRMLAERIAYWNPARVISLGDSFHDGGGSGRLGTSDRTLLASLVSRRDWIWISGNHDPDPPDKLGGCAATSLTIGSITFRHEPLRGTKAPEISGHLHPQASIVRSGKSVRRRCFASDGTRLILPSFGALTGGLNLRDRAFGGLFEISRLEAYLIGRQDLYRIAGANLV